MRRAGRRDEAEAAIVSALEAVGALVYRLDQPCDLAVLWQGRWHMLEVKSPKKGRVYPWQIKQSHFLAITATPIVRTPDQALLAIKALGVAQKQHIPTGGNATGVARSKRKRSESSVSSLPLFSPASRSR